MNVINRWMQARTQVDIGATNFPFEIIPTSEGNITMKMSKGSTQRFDSMEELEKWLDDFLTKWEIEKNGSPASLIIEGKIGGWIDDHNSREVTVKFGITVPKEYFEDRPKWLAANHDAIATRAILAMPETDEARDIRYALRQKSAGTIRFAAHRIVVERYQAHIDAGKLTVDMEMVNGL